MSIDFAAPRGNFSSYLFAKYRKALPCPETTYFQKELVVIGKPALVLMDLHPAKGIDDSADPGHPGKKVVEEGVSAVWSLFENVIKESTFEFPC